MASGSSDVRVASEEMGATAAPAVQPVGLSAPLNPCTPLGSLSADPEKLAGRYSLFLVRTGRVIDASDDQTNKTGTLGDAGIIDGGSEWLKVKYTLHSFLVGFV